MIQNQGNPNRAAADVAVGSSTIRGKLLGGLLVIALIPLIVLGFIAYFMAERAVMTKAGEQLEAVRGSQTRLVREQFQAWERDLAAFAESPIATQGLSDLRSAYRDVLKDSLLEVDAIAVRREELAKFYAAMKPKAAVAAKPEADVNDDAAKKDDATKDDEKPKSDATIDSEATKSATASLSDAAVLLQLQYLANNPNAAGQRQKLDRSSELTTYNERHAIHHPQVRLWLDRVAVRDVILADVESGDIVYSFMKQPYFATNLKVEAAAKTGLGRAFARAAANQAGELAFVDFQGTPWSGSAAVGYLAAPVFDNETKIGVAIWELPFEPIAAILKDRTGLGSTGETVIVGPDRLVRHGTVAADLAGNVKFGSTAAITALGGNKVTIPARNQNGAAVLTAAEPVTVFKGSTTNTTTTWALLTEMSLEEINAPLRQLARVLLAVGVIAALIVGLAALGLSRRMTRQTDAISSMLTQIGIGNFDARAEVVSDDELGHVAQSLNAMCDNTLSLIQTKDERDRIQHAVQKLKEEVAIIASGDLSREAEVTDDVTGGVAESINQMSFQLRTLIGNLHETVTQVTSSADEIRKTTEFLSLGADQQAMQIVGTSSSIAEMAESIQQVSEHTEQSAVVATKARQNAVHGTESVRNTIRGMDRIRDQVQDNSKRIKRLGETSQEVGEIVQLIGDIADRTSILALNASIQAAMAGEAGKGFGVVAEEVERLAERANHATKQIDSLIKAMQSETSEAIMAMEICTQEVVEGSKIAAEAGMALDEIDSVSHDLEELLQSISTATRQQARGADSVSKSMSTISTVTQQTTANTKRAAESVANLAALAEALSDSVAAFKLPKMPPRAVNVFDSPEPHQMNPIGSLILKALK